MLDLRVPSLSALLALSAAAAGTAQDAATGTPAAAGTLLREALAKTAELAGGTFKTVEVQDHAMMRRFAAQMPQEDTEVSGQWHRGLREAKVNETQVILHGGRMLVATGKGGWILRHDTLENGESLPFVLDPELLFAALRDLGETQLAVAHEERTKVGDAEHVIVGLTLDGKRAVDFGLSGAIPGGRGGPVFRIGPMAQMAMPAPELTVDLAFTIDPATKLVHRVRAKVYRVDKMPEGVQIRMGDGAGGEEEEAEDTKEAAKGKDGAKPEYKKGLPVRKLTKDLSLVDYDVKLTNHGEPAKPELDDRACRLLKWSR